MKYLLSALLCLCCFVASAQDLKYEMSEPIDISTAGWDKVLLMPNGNTLLFHFEARKGIVVKVFDKTHKEILSKKHICKILDINALDRSYFNSLTAINNEAMLIVTQHDGNSTLLRLRFDGNTGDLISETRLVMSEKYIQDRMSLFIKQPDVNDYYIVSMGHLRSNYALNEVLIDKYDENHKLIQTSSLDIRKEDFNEISLNASPTSGGIVISNVLGSSNRDRTDKTLVLSFLPNGSKEALYTRISLPKHFDYYTGLASYNPFAHNVNFMMCSQGKDKTKHGKIYSYNYQSLLYMNENMTNPQFKYLDNKKINDLITSSTDTNQLFDGIPILFRTNNFGLSTVAYYADIQNKNTVGLTQKTLGFKRVIGITQFDENGNEVWGTAIPFSTLSHNGTGTKAFGRLSEEEIRNVSVIPSKSDMIAFYNEIPRNMGKTLSNATDSFYNCENTHAVYCRLNKKKETTRHFLFSDPINNELIHAIIGSSDFNEQANLYATVVRHRKGKETQTKIAWVQL